MVKDVAVDVSEINKGKTMQRNVQPFNPRNNGLESEDQFVLVRSKSDGILVLREKKIIERI